MNNGPAKLIDLDLQPGDVVVCVETANDGWLYPMEPNRRVIIKEDGSWFGVAKRLIHELEGKFIVFSRAERTKL